MAKATESFGFFRALQNQPYLFLNSLNNIESFQDMGFKQQATGGVSDQHKDKCEYNQGNYRSNEMMHILILQAWQ